MLDGAARIKPLMEAVAQANQPAIAMTDHGNTFGAFEFASAAQSAGVKPIIGMEAYLTPGTHRTDKTRVRWGSPDQNDDDVSGSEPGSDAVLVQTHAWFEAAIPGWGWLALDPTNGQLVGDVPVI